jgi:hypothetical protein
MGDIPQLVENILKFDWVEISDSERLLVILIFKNGFVADIASISKERMSPKKSLALF